MSNYYLLNTTTGVTSKIINSDSSNSSRETNSKKDSYNLFLVSDNNDIGDLTSFSIKQVGNFDSIVKPYEEGYLDFEDKSDTTFKANISSNTGYRILYQPDYLDIEFDDAGNMNIKENSTKGEKPLIVIIDQFSGSFGFHGDRVMNYALDDIRNKVDALVFDIGYGENSFGDDIDKCLQNIINNIKAGDLQISAINLSQGSTRPNEDTANKIKILTEELGVEIFISAGNEGKGASNGYIQYQDGSTLKNEHLHVVGATDADGNIEQYSSENEYVTDHIQGTFILEQVEDINGDKYYTDGDIIFNKKDIYDTVALNEKEIDSLIFNELKLLNMLNGFEKALENSDFDYPTIYNNLKKDFETLYNSCIGYDSDNSENSNGYIADSDTYLKIQAIIESGENPVDGEIEAKFNSAKEMRGIDGMRPRYVQNGQEKTIYADLTGLIKEHGTSYASPNSMNKFLIDVLSKK